ncbi:MAG: cofactor-independent phosphoglycerate mutase [Gemmataceae bacterium]
MKYAIVIPDGCADDPLPELDGRTPLQAARLPNMDRVAQAGVVGLTNNVPATLTPASDVATLSLFGYDPLEVYTGRAPLEAAARGVILGPDDWAIRCNTVHVPDGHMRDFTSGHISTEEGHQVVRTLANALLDLDLSEFGLHAGQLELVAGVGYRNLLIVRNAGATLDSDLQTQPPHDIPDKPVADFLPRGTGSALLQALMEWSKSILSDHPVNVARRDEGKKDATQIWLWGQGKAPTLVPFVRRYGPVGAITCGVDLVRGVGALLGWDRLEAAGVTDYLDNDYALQGRLAVKNLAEYDLICVHVEAPDEASHEGRADEKIKALERIDEHIVGPLLEALPGFGEWRILISPDHRTPLKTRAHSYGAAPFTVAGTGIGANGQTTYDEVTAAASGLSFDPGWHLMSWFLGEKK